MTIMGISGKTCKPGNFLEICAAQSFQSTAYKVHPTRCRWLADPRPITEPGGKVAESKSSPHRSPSSDRLADSNRTIETQLPLPEMFAGKFWSVTHTQTGESLLSMRCSDSQAMQINVAGSKVRLMF